MTARSLLLEVLVRALYPAMIVASLWILVRGHNQPGGGFIGGMIAVAATAMLGVASGSDRALASIPLGPMALASLGVLLSLTSGIPALLAGMPYMTHLWWEVPLGTSQFAVSTVLLFDFGVYLGVWGALGGFAAHVIGIDEALG